MNILITVIYQLIYNYLIGLYVKEERLHNPCGFVYDIYIHVIIFFYNVDDDGIVSFLKNCASAVYLIIAHKIPT